MTDPAQQRIAQMVKDNPILLFMKGSPDRPQCGFSAAVVDELKKAGVRFATFDVLSEPTIRQGIKEYASWPTIPQLYVNGEFVGGCDIIREMAASGELVPLLEATPH